MTTPAASQEKPLPSVRQKKDPTVVGRVLANGTFRLLTAAHFGGGTSDEADMTLTRNGDNNPFIPGSSLAGVCRSYLVHYFRGNEAFGYFSSSEAAETDEAKLWHKETDITISPVRVSQHEKEVEDVILDLTDLLGAIENEGEQSALCFSDAYPSLANPAKIRIRDGVRIDPKTGQAYHERLDSGALAGAKYDFEIVEPGAEFEVRLELILRQGDNAEILKACLNVLLLAFEQGEIRLGAKTRRGLGRGKVSDWHILELDFHEPEAVLKWLRRSKPADKREKWASKLQNFINQQNYFNLTAEFELLSSVLVRSYRTGRDEPDAVHLFAGDKPVLPGTSLAGVIRHRAERVGHTLARGNENAASRVEKLIRGLFGYVDQLKSSGKPLVNHRASRLRVEEAYIEVTQVQPEIHTRLNVDRFTGSGIDGLLFEEKPLWATEEAKNKPGWQLECRIWQPQPAEIGLLLLVLKDLWLGDLPVGGEAGIGRGMLRGRTAHLTIADGQSELLSWQLGSSDEVLQLEGVEPIRLEEYVSALISFLEG